MGSISDPDRSFPIDLVQTMPSVSNSQSAQRQSGQEPSDQAEAQPRSRIVLRLTFGIPQNVPLADCETFALSLDTALTRIIGGITRYDGTGTWALGSAESDFSGVIERDNVLTYELSMMPDEEVSLFAQIKIAVRTAVQSHALPVDWVHVSRSVAEERIFRIGSTHKANRGAHEGLSLPMV